MTGVPLPRPRRSRPNDAFTQGSHLAAPCGPCRHCFGSAGIVAIGARPACWGPTISETWSGTPVCPVPTPKGSNGGIAIIHPWTWTGRGEKISGHDSCPVTAKCFHRLHAAAACGFKANCERFVQIRARKFRGSRAYGGCEPAISYEYPVPSRHGGTAGHWTLPNNSLSVNAQLLITTGQHLPARLVFRGK